MRQDNGLIRAFIAVEFPDEMKNRLADFQAGLKGPGRNFVKWVDPKLMHLTLKFLGNQGPEKIEVIKKVMEAAAGHCKPFTLSTGLTGCFPNPKNLRIFWLGLEGDVDRLSSLQKGVEGSLAKQGFPVESRPFTAHLTLARLRDECTMQERASFASLIQSACFKPPLSFAVDHIALMKSTLTPRGPVYSRLAEFKLAAQVLD
jgi:RNA 2',3'-cyclic 3'-phosphodiesterase